MVNRFVAIKDPHGELMLDVAAGPINGAAQLGGNKPSGDCASQGCHCVTPVETKMPSATQRTAGSNPAAAPPEPTPADSERSNHTTTDSQESPAAEREGVAWVPWGGGECPVPRYVVVQWLTNNQSDGKCLAPREAA